LLIIVSDGRVMSEGPDRVKQAVRRARHSGIFMVFVIVDNPESKVTTFVIPPLGLPDSRSSEDQLNNFIARIFYGSNLEF